MVAKDTSGGCRHLVVKFEISSTTGMLYATCACGTEWAIDVASNEVERGRRVQGFKPCSIAPERSAIRLYYDAMLDRSRVLCAECIDAWQTNGLNCDLDDLGAAPYAAPCENCVAEQEAAKEAAP